MNIKNKDINKEKPIFIIGSKRGGTTLLRRIINAHSLITIPPPGWFYHFLYESLYSYGDLRKDENVLELINDFLFIPLVKKHWQIQNKAREILDLLPERSFRGILATLFHLYSQKYNTSIWGSKTPSNVFWMKEIQDDFPNARFILLIRDGRDVSVDLFDVFWGPNSLYCSCLLWKSYMQALLKGKELLKPGSYLQVYYEDLVSKPESKVKEICNFLKLEFEPTMLRYYEGEADSFVGKEDYHQATREPITNKYIGMYKNLTTIDRQLQVTVLGDVLRELKYLIDDQPRKIGFWERERYLEYERHGGLILEGAITYKVELAKRQLERKEKGVWDIKDKIKFFTRMS